MTNFIHGFKIKNASIENNPNQGQSSRPNNEGLGRSLKENFPGTFAQYPKLEEVPNDSDNRDDQQKLVAIFPENF